MEPLELLPPLASMGVSRMENFDKAAIVSMTPPPPKKKKKKKKKVSP